MDSQNQEKYLVPMVDRTCQIINLIYESDQNLGVSQISSELNLPKATVYRILSTLSSWDFVEKNDDDRYSLGNFFVLLGSHVKDNMNITKLTSKIIDKLSRETGESVNLGILNENKVITIYNQEGESFYLVSKLIPVSPLYCSSMGKILLTGFNQEDLETYFLENKLNKRTINTIVDKSTMIAELENVRKKDLAYDNEEYEYGLTCMSTSLRDKDRNIVAALSISGPTSRLEYKGFKDMENKLFQAKKEIEEKFREFYN